MSGHARDLSVRPVDEIADYSFHDPDRFRIDPATLPAARLQTMAGNSATRARYAPGQVATS